MSLKEHLPFLAKSTRSIKKHIHNLEASAPLSPTALLQRRKHKPIAVEYACGHVYEIGSIICWNDGTHYCDTEEVVELNWDMCGKCN